MPFAKKIPILTSTMRSVYGQIAVIFLSFAAVFHHTIAKTVDDWSTDPNFSHGFLIPLIAGYMIWNKKNELAHVQILPANSGLAVIIMGMVMHIAGNLGAELFIMRLSLIVTIMGVVLYLTGWKILKMVAIPVAYLLFMVPVPSIIWNKLAFPLQMFAAEMTADTINILGISVFREGNVLHLSNTTLQVVDACSGLRSLTSLMALSCAFAYISSMQTGLKWILFLSAIPVAVTVNIIRLTVTAIMAYHFGPAAAEGFLHDISGTLIFIIALALLYAVFMLLMKLSQIKGLVLGSK